jgi:hypothetical protein
LIERKLGRKNLINFFHFTLIFGVHLNFLLLGCEESSGKVPGRFLIQFREGSFAKNFKQSLETGENEKKLK